MKNNIVLVVIALLVITLFFFYMAICVTWSDKDYCRQGIYTEVTCRDKYTMFNWIDRTPNPQTLENK